MRTIRTIDPHMQGVSEYARKQNEEKCDIFRGIIHCTISDDIRKILMKSHSQFQTEKKSTQSNETWTGAGNIVCARLSGPPICHDHTTAAALRVGYSE